MNEFARYGHAAMDILLSSLEWLIDSIINSIFCLACRSYNEATNDTSTRQVMLFM